MYGLILNSSGMYLGSAPRSDADCVQGEQAHRLVKQLYGRTNKRNATKQIGSHIRQLERAQLAAERLTTDKWPKQDRLCPNEGSMMPDLDIRYQMSTSRNNPVDIYSFVYGNSTDLACTIRPVALSCHLVD
jgi:hypothetical protein